VRAGLQLLTLQVVAMSYLIAFRRPEVAGYQQILLGLTALDLLDASRSVHVAVREGALALVRGATVAAVFAASIDYGPSTAEIRNGSLDAVAALLLGVVVLIGQARRGADAREERRASATVVAAVAEDVRALRAEVGQRSAPPAAPVQGNSAPDRPSRLSPAGGGLLLLGLALGRCSRRRSP
jgi:hypothetical protein